MSIVFLLRYETLKSVTIDRNNLQYKQILTLSILDCGLTH